MMTLPIYISTAVAVITLSIPYILRLLGHLTARRNKAVKAHLLAQARENRTDIDDEAEKWVGVIGFFHPFCNAGGGGERVLWAAIRATQQRWPRAVCVVYTGDSGVTKHAMIQRVEDRFDIHLDPRTVHFLQLSTRRYVLATTWPRFTLLGQSLGSLVLAIDAFLLLTPDILVDTMGYAFVLYLSKLMFPNVPTGAYVHYPTISTDMLESLEATAESGRGVNAGAGRGLKGSMKRRYWQLFAAAYSYVGASVDVVMTNSSWTQAHIQQLWGKKRRKGIASSEIKVVFPPVAVEEMQHSIEVSREKESQRRHHLLYIAQFRPEKNHTLVLQAFAKFLVDFPKSFRGGQAEPRLVLVGSVRDDDDAKRVYKLRLLAHELQAKDHVDFICDATWPQVLDQLRTSSIGVNGMWNEHFGIGVVEYQAAGLISVVNNSGGPKEDIVINIDGEPTGFHASTADEYAIAFKEALSLSADDAAAMRLRARKSAQRFTEEEFAQKWAQNLGQLVKLQGSRQ